MLEEVYNAPATAREHRTAQMHLQAAVVLVSYHVTVDSNLYKTDNVRINVTVRCVPATFAATERQ